jgi:hypothetical protein
MKEILKYISAKNFFEDYCKLVKNYKHKMRGKDGNGKPIDFTEEDKKAILISIKKMAEDTTAKLK